MFNVTFTGVIFKGANRTFLTDIQQGDEFIHRRRNNNLLLGPKSQTPSQLDTVYGTGLSGQLINNRIVSKCVWGVGKIRT